MGVPALKSAIRQQALRAATLAYRGLRLVRGSRNGLRILMYHAVGSVVEDDRRGLYSIAPHLFEQHLDLLANRHAKQLVSLDSHALEGDGSRIAMTFDDGYQDNLVIAAPLLAARGIPFTVFVSTGAVSAQQAGFLVPHQLRELGRIPGARIGSHGVSHRRLTECDDHRLREELAGSKAYLEDLLGTAVDVMSYPHGAVDRRVRDAAEAAGYRLGATSRFDINLADRDPLLLCRAEIWSDDGLECLGQKLRGDWDWYRWRHDDPVGQ
jgi:peptidoglycan/xylan/chitin deacetylase (PgdA/CDA1 family)